MLDIEKQKKTLEHSREHTFFSLGKLQGFPTQKNGRAINRARF